MGYVKAITRKAKIKKSGKIPIEIRITVNRNARYITLGIDIDPKYWDAKNNRVRKSYENSVRINNFINHKMNLVEVYLIKIQEKKKSFDIEEVKARLFDKVIRNYTIKAMCDEFYNELIALEKYTRVSSEKSRIRHLLSFFGENATFDKLTVSNIKKYKTYLLTKVKLAERTAVNHLILVRTLYNRAIREGIADANLYPFGENGVRIKFPDSQKIGLNMDEIKLLEECELIEGTTEWNARNSFLLSFYLAGARISDVLRIKWSDLNDGRLYYKMGKNNKVGSVKITSKAERIINLYKARKNKLDTFVLPELNKADITDNKDIYRKITSAKSKYNKCLKKIAKKVGITKILSCHIARHSFGNISGDKIPVQMLQKLYRHSDITTTINYQQSFMNRETDSALEAVIGIDDE
jgi:integrase/recombinase XerD